MEVINLNLIPTGALPVVHASQYDEGRTFRANLMDGSTVYTLDGTETLECDVKKPDGNIVTVAVTNTSDSYVEIDTTLQMCACAGESLAELHITKRAQEIGTINFILAVERSPLEGGIASQSEIDNLATQVAGLVATEVANQYDSANVIFDNDPTTGHGVGYAVTSEGVKNAIDAISPAASAVSYDNTASGLAATNVQDALDEVVDVCNDNFADAYDPTATYNTGDVCIYNNVLYICTDDNITGTFDPSKWTATTIDNIIGSLSTLTTTDKSSLVGAVNEVVANKVNGWTFVNEALGNTTINLPTGWKEILAVCRYGNGGGLQPQAVSFVLIPEQKGLTMTAGGSTILAQVVVSADTTKVNMAYFGVAGTDYTSDSQIRVWYR